MKKNLLIVTQYFWPENFRINDFAKAYADRGYHVTVLTGKPNYPEGNIFPEYRATPETFDSYHGVEIIRVPMVARGKNSNLRLALNYVSFLLSGSTFGRWRLRNKKFDFIFIFGISPLTQAIPAIFIGRSRRIPAILWVLDLWPDTLSAVGAVKNAAALKLAGKMMSWIYNRIDYLLYQSHAFRPMVQQYCTTDIDPARLRYFPSWSDTADLPAINRNDIPSKLYFRSEPDDFYILFAGNIGDAQDFEHVVKAALDTKIANIRWVIVGDGSKLAWLQETIETQQIDNIMLMGRHPLESMPYFLTQADALLVSLKDDPIFSKIIPGKVQTYMAASKPILGMISGETQFAIQTAECGYVGNGSDAQALAKNAIALSQLKPAELARMGENGQRYYHEHFDKTTLFDELEQLFQQAAQR